MTDDRRTVLLALAQRGWTVYDLAQAARCPVATLRPWLAGTGAISQDDRDRIMAAIAQDPSGGQP